MVLTIQRYTVLCILYVNMVLTVQDYSVSEIISPGGLTFTVNQI